MKKQNSLKNPLIRFFSCFGYVRIRNPPSWVENKSAFIRTKSSRNPFKVYTKKVKGKNFLYKSKFENSGQGNCKEKWWVKRKLRRFYLLKRILYRLDKPFREEKKRIYGKDPHAYYQEPTTFKKIWIYLKFILKWPIIFLILYLLIGAVSQF